VTKNGQKTTWTERALIIIAILVGSAIVVSGIAVFVAYRNQRSMELTQFTQCFRALEQPWGVNRVDGKNEFYKDEKHHCYGQRWSMPRAYFGHKYVSYHPVTETVVIRIGRPGLTPGNLIPRGEFVPLYNDINIEPLWAGRFEDHVRHTKNTYQVTGGLEKIDRTMFGMDVYDQKRMPRDQYRDIFFFPPNNPQLFAKCIVKPGHSIDEKFRDGPCNIVANINDRVRIEYSVKYSEMPELEQINTSLANLVSGFMIN
jgi:hypothetical protein